MNSTRGKRLNNRVRETTGFGKQAERPTYPLGPWLPGYWASYPPGWPGKPVGREFGVPADPYGPLLPNWPETHTRFQNTYYFMRRVKHVPQLKSILIEPLAFPLTPRTFRDYYPFYRYPSGQLNPNWWRGFDDDGNPPP